MNVCLYLLHHHHRHPTQPMGANHDCFFNCPARNENIFCCVIFLVFHAEIDNKIAVSIQSWHTNEDFLCCVGGGSVNYFSFVEHTIHYVRVHGDIKSGTVNKLWACINEEKLCWPGIIFTLDSKPTWFKLEIS